MPILKGQSLNPNGRPKGIPNKQTTEIKQVINTAITYLSKEGKLENILDNLTKNKPEVLLQFISKVAPKTLFVEDQTPTYKPNPLFEVFQEMRVEQKRENDLLEKSIENNNEIQEISAK